MRFVVTRHGFNVVPESPEDVAFIEDTMGLKNEYDAILLVRSNVHKSNDIANLTTNPFPVRDMKIVGVSPGVSITKKES